MANEQFIAKQNYVHLGGFAVWIAATALMMLHNGEATYARATTGGMQPLRAFIEAALTVLTIEVIGLYFLYAASKPEITVAQRQVAGWGLGLSVALGAFINLVGGVAGAEGVLNIAARIAQGVCLVLIVRWHWVGHSGQQAEKGTQQAQGEAFDPVLVSAVIESKIEAKFAQLARPQTVQAMQITVNQAQPEPQAVAQAEIVVRKPAQARPRMAQLKAASKIDGAQLAALLAQKPDAPAAEFAQLFNTTPQGIRARPEWKAAKAVQS